MTCPYWTSSIFISILKIILNFSLALQYTSSGFNVQICCKSKHALSVCSSLIWGKTLTRIESEKGFCRSSLGASPWWWVFDAHPPAVTGCLGTGIGVSTLARTLNSNLMKFIGLNVAKYPHLFYLNPNKPEALWCLKNYVYCQFRMGVTETAWGQKHCLLWELETTWEPPSHEISSSYKRASVWVGSAAVNGSEDEKGQKTFEPEVWTKAPSSQWKVSDWWLVAMWRPVKKAEQEKIYSWSKKIVKIGEENNFGRNFKGCGKISFQRLLGNV